MVRGGASPALAQDMANMVEAQNDAIYDAEPRNPCSATATGFRQWYGRIPAAVGPHR